jgi:cob(I)alamin adenosyltransferase
MTASLPVPGLTSGSGAGSSGATQAGAAAPWTQRHPQRPGHRPLGVAAPAPLLRLVAQQEGLLQIHTAPFRGSFGAVLSQALRTAGLGSRVLVSQFLKGGVDQGLDSSLWLCGRLQWLRPGVPACLSELAADQDLDAVEAVRQVWAFSREQLLSGAVDLMVLDELGLAVELGYIEKAEVLAVLERRPAHLDVILTGPAMATELMAMADQVTQLRRGL